MNTPFDTPPARNTRSGFSTPPARNTRSRSRRSRTTPYPVAKPKLNTGRTSTRHQGAAATTLFQGRSVLPSQKVSKAQLMTLIRSDGLSNDISYELHDSLRISDCPGLKCLSGNISVKGGLMISHCPELRTISANLFVGGDFSITSCPLLASIDGSVTVQGGMIIPSAPMVAMPGTFCIRGSLYLMCSSHLRDLSGSYSVGYCADFNRCKRLRDLSGRFNVGRSLDLSCCQRLTNLSGTFAVGEGIDLNHCTRLRSVPDWITSLGPESTGQTRNVDLEFSGLSDTSIDQLHSAKIPGMDFHTTSEKTRQPLKQFNNWQEGLAFWSDLAHSDIPQLNLQPDQTEDMLDFFERLTWTPEYWDKNYRPILAQRVMQVITLVLTNNHLREKALTHISECTSSPDEVIGIGLKPLENMLKGSQSQARQFPTDSA